MVRHSGQQPRKARWLTLLKNGIQGTHEWQILQMLDSAFAGMEACLRVNHTTKVGIQMVRTSSLDSGFRRNGNNKGPIAGSLAEVIENGK